MPLRCALTRLSGNGVHQTETRPRRRPGPCRGQREQSHITAELFQLTAANAAGLKVRLQGATLVPFRQGSQSVQGQIFCELVVNRHFTKAVRNVVSAVRMRVLIVPSGVPVFAAISECVSPSKNAI